MNLCIFWCIHILSLWDLGQSSVNHFLDNFLFSQVEMGNEWYICRIHSIIFLDNFLFSHFESVWWMHHEYILVRMVGRLIVEMGNEWHVCRIHSRFFLDNFLFSHVESVWWMFHEYILVRMVAIWLQHRCSYHRLLNWSSFDYMIHSW